jgi:hypothetical protein
MTPGAPTPGLCGRRKRDAAMTAHSAKHVPHCPPAPAHDDGTRPLRVEYQQSRELSPEECRRRVQLAYGYILGIIPWPEELAAVAMPAPKDEAAGSQPEPAAPSSQSSTATRPLSSGRACRA